jgi:hypothetical protein
MGKKGIACGLSLFSLTVFHTSFGTSRSAFLTSKSSHSFNFNLSNNSFLVIGGIIQDKAVFVQLAKKGNREGIIKGKGTGRKGRNACGNLGVVTEIIAHLKNKFKNY